ncbi:hypothetical protein QYE76_052332 [Lolium multiflorum]|uniref:F-box domain-containing protein n=1 Tax=Lolium multiflorum TaxID=4521 RepID=A0AAD8SVE8_LOLMU|nr:hypothetical protein QYE76_052332 [Lolium multiflorum]
MGARSPASLACRRLWPATAASTKCFSASGPHDANLGGARRCHFPAPVGLYSARCSLRPPRRPLTPSRASSPWNLRGLGSGVGGPCCDGRTVMLEALQQAGRSPASPDSPLFVVVPLPLSDRFSNGHGCGGAAAMGASLVVCCHQLWWVLSIASDSASTGYGSYCEPAAIVLPTDDSTCFKWCQYEYEEDEYDMNDEMSESLTCHVSADSGSKDEDGSVDGGGGSPKPKRCKRKKGCCSRCNKERLTIYPCVLKLRSKHSHNATAKSQYQATEKERGSKIAQVRARQANIMELESNPAKKCAKAKGVEASSEEDRLSGLPDDVLHSILGVLPLKHAVRTSALSMRWAHKWLHALATSAVLDFTDRDLVHGQSTAQITATVDRVLAIRGAAPIHVFRVALSPLDELGQNVVLGWVAAALGRGVREVGVDLGRRVVLDDGVKNNRYGRMTEGAKRGSREEPSGPDHRAAPRAWPRHPVLGGPTAPFASFSASSRKSKPQRGPHGYSRLCGAENTREKRALPAGRNPPGKFLPEGEIDAIAIVIERDIISIIIIIISTIYTAITTAAPQILVKKYSRNWTKLSPRVLFLHEASKTEDLTKWGHEEARWPARPGLDRALPPGPVWPLALTLRLLKASVAKPPVPRATIRKTFQRRAAANPISGDSGDRLRHPAGEGIHLPEDSSPPWSPPE